MSRLVEIYLEAKRWEKDGLPTREEFLKDMRRKEYVDPNGVFYHKVRFEMTIGSGKHRQVIQEEHSFENLAGMYDSFVLRRQVEDSNKSNT